MADRELSRTMSNERSRLDWDPTTHYQSEGVASSYDVKRFSSLAGGVYQRLERRAVLRAFRQIAPQPKVILDLPCGTGRLAETLLSAGYKVVGADISSAMLRQAEQRLGRFGDRFITLVCDARKAAQQPVKFDAALCARVLMHFPLNEQIEFLRGVSGAVGHYVVFTHSLDTPYQRLRRSLKRRLGHQPSVGYPIAERDLKELLAKSGLKEIRRLRLPRLLSEAIVIIAEKAARVAPQ